MAAAETFAPGGSSMNGMNLSGKPGMVQPLQMPPTLGQPEAVAAAVGAAADAGHRAAFGHVAIHHWTPAAQFHDALRGAVNFREITLLVIAGAIAAVVDGFAKEPERAQLVVQRNHGSEASDLI